ncbi:alpha/beta hydrolase family protein [Horticoccus sp. 23ND18S-11]|uniref:alpha/beta hydrolase family protein n=1 Tax=Horticoccus sp. 23ND18S-11 TaxID=3391832 RepID=UPI0039C94AF8
MSLRFLPGRFPQSAAAIVFAAAMVTSTSAQTPAAAAAAMASPLHELDRYAPNVMHPGSQLRDHIYERSRRFFAAGDAARDALTTPEAVRARQELIRLTVVASLGGLPSLTTPLNARVTGTVEGDGFRIEKIIFESRPRHYVTANLYVPNARPSSRTGAVLFLSGHHNAAKQVAEYQLVCQVLARAGLVVLSQDPVGQGERLSYVDPKTGANPVGIGTREHDYAGTPPRLLGDTLARVMLHDAMRGIDYLISRPEVDPARIGVTGNSGGGTQTSLLMLADPRVAAAAPGTFIMNRDSYQRTGQPQDAEQIWPGFTAAGFDHEDILLALAPKPVSVLAVTSDFFPIEGTRRTVARSRRIWELFDRSAALEHHQDDSTHAYTLTLARAAARFFARHLLGSDVDLAGFEPKAFPPEQLQCTKSGQVRIDFPDAESVPELTAAHLQMAEAARAALAPAVRREQARTWLRAEVMRQREDIPLYPRRLDRGRKVGPYVVDAALWNSQPNLFNAGLLIRLQARGTAPQPVTLALWDQGTAAISRHAEWIAAECAQGRAVFVLCLSGMGPLQPDAIGQRGLHESFGTWHKLADDLDWMGDSLVALRTYEMLRAVDVLAEWPDLRRDDLRVVAEGRVGVHARLAAALDPRLSRCEWNDGFRYADFVRSRTYEAKDLRPYLLPGVLRHFDLDDL